MGGHRRICVQCGHVEQAYNSCRNRHCPKCQAGKRADWLAARQKDLLPVEYFHVVFTMPDFLADVALQNPSVVYGILFRAAAQTLQEVAADARHLGVRIGVLAVLHTWGQNLLHHPHVHCVVPGGGLSSDGSCWKSCTPGFFLPVEVLSIVYRAKFLAQLKAAYRDGKLQFHGSLTSLRQADVFSALLDRAYQRDWVVYCKPPFGGPEQVLKYLARYTHRVAISNHRLVSLENGQVTFRWKDYAQGNRIRQMTISAVEFIRRLMLHVLPKGFVKIRHYGLLANCHRKEKLARCRELLEQASLTETGTCRDAPRYCLPEPAEGNVSGRCPRCQEGKMILLELYCGRPLTRPKLDHL